MNGAMRHRWASALRGAPVGLALLSAALVGAFLWWRIAAQYGAAETFWADPLSASAAGFRSRVSVWLDARRETGTLLASLLARNGGRTAAFDAAAKAVLSRNGVEAITIRARDRGTRCERGDPVPICTDATTRYAISSPEHAQALRVRPMPDGRVLVPVVTALPGGGEGGTLTQWIDPEVALIPELLRVHGTVRLASTTFVRRDADSAVVLHADTAAAPQRAQRFLVDELPTLYGRPPVEGVLTRGTDIHGTDAIGVAAYLPLLRWHVYRSISRETAFAAFRSEITTEASLAFLLGSFIVGLMVWTIRERRSDQVRAALVQARLDSLQAQLRPHFLFNALNTVAAMLHEDLDAAERMLVKLGDLLRLSLEESAHALIPVRRELALMNAYVEVERVRFGDSLRVTSRVERSVSDLLVPRWVLQPLVENAIKHGGAYTRGEANISVAITRSDGRLIVVVVDDGPRVNGQPSSEGVGLRNTRQRLESLFGLEARITLRHPESGGTEVILEMPARRSEGTASEPPSPSAVPIPGVGAIAR
jgi:signal transduction histidine kinase